MASRTTHPAPPADERHQKRLGNLGGDRLCLGCHYNLKHQPFWRESRYGLLIVRCPECGRAASLDDQPVALSRFASHAAWLIAAPWCVLILAYLAAIASANFGFAMLTTLVASEPFQFGRRPAGWLALNWAFLMPLGLTCLVAFIGGLVWRVLTCGEGRWAARWSILGLLMLEGLFCWLAIDDWFEGARYSNSFATLAMIGPAVLVISLAASLLAHALGLLVGRRLGAAGLRLIRRDVSMLPGFSASR